jgi:hypothetical protein
LEENGRIPDNTIHAMTTIGRKTRMKRMRTSPIGRLFDVTLPQIGTLPLHVSRDAAHSCLLNLLSLQLLAERGFAGSLRAEKFWNTLKESGRLYGEIRC